MRSGAFVIPVQHLAAGDTVFALPASSEVLQGTDIIGNVAVNAVVNKVDNRFLLHCDITVTFDHSCDRCLDDFEGQFHTSYEQWYVLDRPDPSFAEEEAYVIPRETRFITIDDDVHENILLEQPSKFLCSNECKGLCPTCGKNLNREHCDCNDTAKELYRVEIL